MQNTPEILDCFNRFPKLALWFQLFLDVKNTFGLNTLGNSTQSVIHAYRLDPSDPKQYATASVIGSQNLRKLKIQAGIYYEMQGLTTGKILDLIANKVVNTNNVKCLRILAELTKVYKEDKTIPIRIDVKEVTVAEKIQPSKDFEEFINEKYNSL